MDYRNELRSLMQQITEQIGVLNSLLHDATLYQAAVYELPIALAGAEREPTTVIPVTPHSDPLGALSRACHAYGQFYLPPDSPYSTQSPFRLPGYLLVETPNVQHGFQLVKHINHLKKSFSNIVIHAIPQVSQRFPLLHDHLFPGLITLQLYRHIIATDTPMQSIRFFWANKQSIVCLDQKSVLESLYRAQVNPGRSFLAEDYEHWFASVEDEIALIKSLPDNTQFRIRRPVPVQPMIRFAPVPAPHHQAKAMSCPLPAIIFMRQSTQLPFIRPLETYQAFDVKHRRQPTPRQELELLIPRLHLYRLLD